MNEPAKMETLTVKEIVALAQENNDEEKVSIALTNRPYPKLSKKQMARDGEIIKKLMYLCVGAGESQGDAQDSQSRVKLLSRNASPRGAAGPCLIIPPIARNGLAAVRQARVLKTARVRPAVKSRGQNCYRYTKKPYLAPQVQARWVFYFYPRNAPPRGDPGHRHIRIPNFEKARRHSVSGRHGGRFFTRGRPGEGRGLLLNTCLLNKGK